MGISEKELKKEIDDFKKKSKEQNYMDFAELINIFEKIEIFLKGVDLGDYTDDEIGDFVDKAIEVYKKKKGELKKNDLDSFRKYLNFIIFALGLYPITVDGKEMTEEEYEKWFKIIYMKHIMTEEMSKIKHNK